MIEDISGLGKPAAKLIEVVSGGISNLYEPTKIKRLAKANTLGLIESVNIIENTDLPNDIKRAMLRKVGLDLEAQDNLDSITNLAIPLLKEMARPEDIDSDWLSKFRINCEFIGDEEIQSMWAKILAEEANNKNSISKATLNVLGVLSKNEANLFTNIASSCLQDGDGNYIPLILPDAIYSDLYNELGFRPKNFFLLEEIGLIRYNGMAGYGNDNYPNIVRLIYFDKIVQFKRSGEKGTHRFEFGDVMLTRTGQELVKHSGRTYCSNLLDKTLEIYQSKGYTTEIIKQL